MCIQNLFIFYLFYFIYVLEHRYSYPTAFLDLILFLHQFICLLMSVSVVSGWRAVRRISVRTSVHAPNCFLLDASDVPPYA